MKEVLIDIWIGIVFIISVLIFIGIPVLLVYLAINYHIVFCLPVVIYACYLIGKIIRE
jgi:hypothetical protein